MKRLIFKLSILTLFLFATAFVTFFTKNTISAGAGGPCCVCDLSLWQAIDACQSAENAQLTAAEASCSQQFLPNDEGAYNNCMTQATSTIAMNTNFCVDAATAALNSCYSGCVDDYWWMCYG